MFLKQLFDCLFNFIDYWYNYLCVFIHIDLFSFHTILYNNKLLLLLLLLYEIVNNNKLILLLLLYNHHTWL